MVLETLSTDEPIHLTVIITPKPGKADEWIEIFKVAQAQVKANEPDVTVYELRKAKTNPTGEGPTILIVRERYNNSAAMKAHSAAEYLKPIHQSFGPDGIIEKAEIYFGEDEIHGFSR